MTQSIQNYSVNAVMARAAYANLAGDKDDNILALVDVKIGFTTAQAESFLNQYSVAYHYPDDSTGLSFTIFKDNATNQLTLAIRGTEGVVDLLEDGVLATTGLAQNQALSLFNAMQILTTTPTTEGFVQSGKFQITETIDGVLYGYKETSINSGQRDESTKTALIGYDADSKTGTFRTLMPDLAFYSDVNYSALLGLASEFQSGQVNIAGHSLGGHLAFIASQFINNVGHVYTYNAPGIDTNHSELSFLAGHDFSGSVSDLSNLVSNGYFEFTANETIFQRPGVDMNVFIENEGFFDSHKIRFLSDSLRVMTVMERVGGSVGTHALQTVQAYSVMLEKASFNDVMDLDKAVDFLYNIFIPNGTDSGFENRLWALEQANLPSGNIISADSIGNKPSSIAELYAVLVGSPFVITGVDYSGTALGLAGKLDMSLYSEEFLSARTEYLKALLSGNAVDTTTHTGNWQYIHDGLTGTTLYKMDAGEHLRFVNENSSSFVDPITGTSNQKNTIFGSTGSDYIKGSNKADKLYGEAGNDHIWGGAGNDEIHAGNGENWLYGESGNDILVGGSGNDTLDGGADNDRLVGGAGNDTYIFSQGRDIISDASGNDTITAGGNCAYVIHRGKQIVFDLNGKNDLRVKDGFVENIQIGDDTLNANKSQSGVVSATGSYHIEGHETAIYSDNATIYVDATDGVKTFYGNRFNFVFEDILKESQKDLKSECINSDTNLWRVYLEDGATLAYVYGYKTDPIGYLRAEFKDPTDPDDELPRLDDQLPGLENDWGNTEKTQSPLIFDLNGDGVKTTHVIDSQVYFDLDGNGFAEKTAWADADDGFLVRDLNGNGMIDNGSELFGNNTALSNGLKAANGFEALKDLDSNGGNDVLDKTAA